MRIGRMNEVYFRQTRVGAALCGILILLTTPDIAAAQSAADGQAAFERGDVASAARIWQPLAEHGDAAAQVGLGNLYALGKGVSQDFATAAQWFEKAAQQNSAIAQFNLGSLYLKARGVPRDETKATQWFRRAAEQGYAPAQTSYAYQLESGSGIAKNEAEAAQWYRRAALQANAGALVNLGSLYDEGRGVARQPVLGSALMLAAAAAAPTRQDIAKLSSDAQAKLTPSEREQALAMSRQMAQPGGLDQLLAKVDAPVAVAATAAAAATAGPVAAPGGSKQLTLSGGCSSYTLDGETLLPAWNPVPCANAVTITLPAAGKMRLDIHPPGLRSATLEFKQAQQNFPPSASLYIASVNGHAVSSGECNFAPVTTTFRAAMLRCFSSDAANRQPFEFALIIDERREQIANQTSFTGFFDALGTAYNAMQPEAPYKRPPEPKPAPAAVASAPGNPSTNAAARVDQPVFGLRIGAPIPRGLPACSNDVRGILGTGWLAEPKPQAALCVGATEGGLNQSGNQRFGKITVIPLLPSDAVLQREFPELAAFTFGNASFMALVDDAKILQGVIVTSVVMGRNEWTSAMTMLKRRFGAEPEEQKISTIDKSISGLPVQVNYSNWIWRDAKGVARAGPPVGQPQADAIQILLLTPALAASEFGIR